MTEPFHQQPQPGPYQSRPPQHYGEYPPPQQPYGAPYPPPRRPKNKTPWPVFVLVGVLAFCGLAGCISVVAGVDDTASKGVTTSVAPKPNAAAAEPAAPPAAAPIEQAPPKPDYAPAGSAVRDGKFEFVVTQVQQGLKVVGDNPYLQKEAQGLYVLVYTTVTNTSNRPQSYFGSNQTLIDAQGREFTNDAMAEINVNDAAVVGADINPGNKLNVVIAFDVPTDAQPAVIEFHDSMFSGGAKVALQ